MLCCPGRALPIFVVVQSNVSYFWKCFPFLCLYVKDPKTKNNGNWLETVKVSVQKTLWKAQIKQSRWVGRGERAREIFLRSLSYSTAKQQKSDFKITVSLVGLNILRSQSSCFRTYVDYCLWWEGNFLRIWKHFTIRCIMPPVHPSLHELSLETGC